MTPQTHWLEFKDRNLCGCGQIWNAPPHIVQLARELEVMTACAKGMASRRNVWEERAIAWKEAARSYRATAKENARLLQKAYVELWDVQETMSLLREPR